MDHYQLIFTCSTISFIDHKPASAAFLTKINSLPIALFRGRFIFADHLVKPFGKYK
jgi:hypothetical protein